MPVGISCPVCGHLIMTTPILILPVLLFMSWQRLPSAGLRLFLREALVPEHDPEKCVAVFGKDHAPTNNLERDGDSKKSHPALGPAVGKSWIQEAFWKTLKLCLIGSAAAVATFCASSQSSL